MTWYRTWDTRLTWLWTWSLLTGLATAGTTTPLTTAPGTGCVLPYEAIGSRCLFVESVVTGPWNNMRQLCQDLGGDLVGLQDANLLSDIFKYLQSQGTVTVSYWVGATDQDREGSWVWVDDHSPVHLGTPLWGDLVRFRQEPNGGHAENCAVLNHEDNFYLHDVSCEASHSLICQDTRTTSQSPLEKPLVTSNQPRECPDPYEVVGGRCLYLDLTADVWPFAREICEALGGQLVKLDDANLLGAVYDYILAHELIDRNFWVGANDVGHEGVWLWLDNSSTTLGTPFWGNYAMDTQQPDGDNYENCAYLNLGDYYFMHDWDCYDYGFYTKWGVICQYDMTEGQTTPTNVRPSTPTP